MLTKYIAAVGLTIITLAPAVTLALEDDYGTGTGGTYCPKLTSTFQRGARDATTGGQVSELQTFLADYYDLPESTAVSGFYGKTTEKYVKQFQQANGLPAQGIIGTLTRATIAKKCGGSGVTNEPAPRTSVTGNTSLGELEQLRKSNASKKCVLANYAQAAVYYMANGMITASSPAGMHVTLRDGIQYTWSPKGSDTAYKTATDPATILRGTEKQLTCEDWTADLSMFEIPTTVNFKDQTLLLEEARVKGRDARRVADIKQLQLALELYYDKYGKYPTGFDEKGTQAPGTLGVLVTESLITRLPTDPQAMTPYIYASKGKGAGYLLSAILESKTYAAFSNDIDGNVSVDNGIVGCDDVGGIYCVQMDTQAPVQAPLGLYEGYLNGSKFITTPSISRENAYANCHLNATNNPSSSVRCTWNGTEIYTRAGTASSAALKGVQVVGVYEGSYLSGVSHSFGNSPEGTVNLTIDGGSGTAPVLVLSSYEPVNWVINNPSGVQFEKVITLGYHDQRVTGLAASTPIESHSYAKDKSYAWSCAYANYETNGGCSYNSLKTWLSARGYSVANFTGAYAGKSFTINIGTVSAATKESQVANAYAALVSALEALSAQSWFK